MMTVNRFRPRSKSASASRCATTSTSAIRDDVSLWCRRLGLTPLQLCSLVERVGNDASNLQHALRTK